MTKIGYSSLSEVWGDASNENTSTENTPTVKYNSNVDNDNKGVNYTGGFNYNSSIKPLSNYASNPEYINDQNKHIGKNMSDPNYENLKEYASNKIKSYECDKLLEHLEICEHCRHAIKTTYLDKWCKIYKNNEKNSEKNSEKNNKDVNLKTEHFSGTTNESFSYMTNSKIKIDKFDIVIISLTGIFIIYVLDCIFKLGKTR